MADLTKIVQEVEEALDKYETENAGLSKWQKMDEPVYLHMPMADLRKKEPVELAEAEIELNRFALSVDRVIGKNRAWERWAKSKLNQISAEALENISSSYGFNERMHLARHRPELCVKLNEFLRRVEMRISRLESVPENVRNIASCIKGLRFAAVSREKNSV